MTQPSLIPQHPPLPYIKFRLKDCIAPQFRRLHGFIKRQELHDFDELWLKGGRGSTKSSFTAIQIILGIVSDPKANALCVRKVGDTIRDSLTANLSWAIDALGLADRFRIKLAPAEIIYLPTGQKIMLRGLDDPRKLKSIKVRKGYIKYLWFEELAEYANYEEVRNVAQSVLRGGEGALMFCSYNPPNDPRSWVNEEAKVYKKNRKIHTSCYTHVPPEWLGAKFLRDALHLQLTDELAYRHEYLGEAVGNKKAIIFSDRYRVEDFDVQPDWEGPYQGVDFGFSQDPSTIVRLWIDDKHLLGVKPKLYVEFAKFGHGVELDELPEFYRGMLFEGSAGPPVDKVKIRADSAQPATISHLKNKYKFNIEGAEKWAGSVEEGIRVLKTFDIIIHTRNVKMIEEAAKYSYKVDAKTGDILTIIVDDWNHGWDAIRYALAPFIKKKAAGFFDCRG